MENKTEIDNLDGSPAKTEVLDSSQLKKDLIGYVDEFRNGLDDGSVTDYHCLKIMRDVWKKLIRDPILKERLSEEIKRRADSPEERIGQVDRNTVTGLTMGKYNPINWIGKKKSKSEADFKENLLDNIANFQNLLESL